MKGGIHDGFEIGSWQVFPSRNLLVGPPGDVHIEPKVMQVLVCLANDAGNVVSHDTFMNKVWGGRAYSDEPLSRCIFELRRALGESSRNPKCIETIPKSGYRLVATVKPLGAPQARIPSGGRRFGWTVLLVVVLVAGAFVALRPTETGLTESSPTVVGSASRVSSASYSIAVLPFANLTTEPGQEFFADGLWEEVLNLLATVPDLKVIGQRSSFSFKGKNGDPRKIGATLGVKTVLEGSVRKSGDRVRITGQLIDTSDGTLIWSQSFERPMTDVFALQDDIAAAIVDALQIHVSTSPARGRPTVNTEAYALFLKAKALLSEGKGDGVLNLLLSAVKLDPEFADAHEALALAHWSRYQQQATLEAAARALAINPDLVQARAAYESASTGSHLVGIEAFERALQRQPDNLRLMRSLAWNLLQAGYIGEALALSRRVLDIDPLNTSSMNDLGIALYAAGYDSEAFLLWDAYLRLTGRDESFEIGGLYLAARQDEQAIARFETYFERRGHTDTGWVRELVTRARDPATGPAYLDRRIPELVSTPLAAGTTSNITDTGAEVYLYFGHIDRYMEHVFDRDPNDSRWTMADFLLFAGVMTRRTGFTAHPKFLEIAEMMGLVRIWEKRGPPDFCEKAGERWVCE